MREAQGKRVLGRVGSLVIACVATSAVVAAIGFAASDGSASSKKDKDPASAGQVKLGTGPSATTFPMLAYSWGVSNSGSTHVGGGAGAGKANVQDLSFTKFVDATTVEFLKKVTTGAHYANVVITATESETSATLVYELDDVLVTAVSLGSSGGERKPTENVTLNFAKVKWTYTDADGKKSSGSWDVAANTE